MLVYNTDIKKIGLQTRIPFHDKWTYTILLLDNLLEI